VPIPVVESDAADLSPDTGGSSRRASDPPGAGENASPAAYRSWPEVDRPVPAGPPTGVGRLGPGGSPGRPPGSPVGARWRSPVVDLGDVAVVRGPVAAVRARQVSARALTAGGTVFLPDDIGALHDTAGRAVLAHELAHVVQQRVLGADLPDESTPAGQVLEAQAVAAAQAAWQHAPAPVANLVPHPGTTAESPVQRLAVADDSPVTTRPGIEHGPPVVDDGPSMSDIRDELGRRPPRRWVDIDAAQDLEELANLLYDRLHHRLRTDVLVQRERAGLLMDHR
jgi:hypothetical protein